MSKAKKKIFVQANANKTGKTTPFQSLDVVNSWSESQDNYSIARILESAKIDFGKDIPNSNRHFISGEINSARNSNERYYREQIMPLIRAGVLTYKKGVLTSGPNAGRALHYDRYTNEIIFDDCEKDLFDGFFEKKKSNKKLSKESKRKKGFFQNEKKKKR